MRFEGRLGIQQRVLPGYRVPFFEQLAECCEGGLSILAGQPMARESIEDGAAALRITVRASSEKSEVLLFDMP